MEQVMNCWACELARGERRQHKTRWFYLSSAGVVAEDLRSKGYALRLLFVPDYGPGTHVACGQESAADHESAIALLSGVAKARLPGYDIVSYDLTNHSFTRHWHAQACLEAR